MATKVAALSTSLIDKVPDVERTVPFSISVWLAVPITAASLVPTMLTVIVLVVPSALATVNVSL
ncbi:hypothetical protein LP420_05075 [Massilia sp. B-10]|nr:hypothetical protein LP420_05075 [Massilia sp. B-10]UUZ55166.1 hypothetical protein LP419_04775 [Massilia sp. H-1]